MCHVVVIRDPPNVEVKSTQYYIFWEDIFFIMLSNWAEIGLFCCFKCFPMWTRGNNLFSVMISYLLCSLHIHVIFYGKVAWAKGNHVSYYRHEYVVMNDLCCELQVKASSMCILSQYIIVSFWTHYELNWQAVSFYFLVTTEYKWLCAYRVTVLVLNHESTLNSTSYSFILRTGCDFFFFILISESKK
jgi:hypothetical protein